MTASHTSFIPEDLEIQTWSDIEPYFDALKKSRPRTLPGLKLLVDHYSAVLEVYEESAVQDAINANVNLDREETENGYEDLQSNLECSYECARNAVERTIVRHLCFPQLGKDGYYRELYRLFRHRVHTFREEQMDVFDEIDRIQERCEEILNSLPVYDIGSGDREKRREDWFSVQKAYDEVRDQLDALLGSLILLRHRQGRSAGYKNFREFSHYGSKPRHRISDATRFHRVIRSHVVPVTDALVRKHQKRLGLEGDVLYPWDIDWGSQATPADSPILRPFETSEELLEKSIRIFFKIHPQFGACLQEMKSRNLIDLEEREHKRKIDCCYDLPVQGMPFISMIPKWKENDVPTLMHEGGHAFHTYCTRDEPLIFYRFFGLSTTMAETVGHAMELMSSRHWGEFYPDAEALKVARRNLLERFVRFLPWCAIVDRLQHWMYKNPLHTSEEREAYFARLMRDFYPPSISWDGLDRYRSNYYREIEHMYVDPFDYIEHGFSIIGALQLHRNYLEDPKATIQAFMRGLRMGASRPYGEVWQEMGIRRDFSAEMVSGLMEFVMEQLKELD